jgi:hypothetical protein
MGRAFQQLIGASGIICCHIGVGLAIVFPNIFLGPRKGMSEVLQAHGGLSGECIAISINRYGYYVEFLAKRIP